MTKNVSQKLLDSMLGFAAGGMIAASVLSLIITSIEMSDAMAGTRWIPAAIGFLPVGIFLRIRDAYLAQLRLGLPRKDAEGVETGWRLCTLLVLAITLHNIPDG